MQSVLADIQILFPELLIAGGLIASLVVSFFSPKKIFAYGIPAVFHAAALFYLSAVPARSGSYFSHNFLIHSHTDFFRFVIVLFSLGALLLFSVSREINALSPAETSVAVSGSTIGSLFMILSSSMPSLYIAVEFSSILSYILARSKQNGHASEGAVKYAVYGAVSSGFLLFAMSILYASSGSLSLTYISGNMIHEPDSAIHLIFFALFLGGIGYKIAVFPFHSWSPDVYEGSPVPAVFYFSIPRIAGFAFMLLFFENLLIHKENASAIMNAAAVISIITMTVGNLSALPQTGFKRMLAWSSIAHGGYVFSLFSLENSGLPDALHYYLFAYAVMTGGAFAVYQLTEGNETGMESLKGLAYRGASGALLAAATVGFIFSLIGIPPFAGFFAKYFVFGILIEEKRFFTAVIMGLNTILSVYYYMKVLKLIYFEKPDSVSPISPVKTAAGIVIVLSLLNLAAGIFPVFVMSPF